MDIEVLEISFNRASKAQEGLALAIGAARELSANVTILVGSKAQYPNILIQTFLSVSESDLLKSKGLVTLQNGIHLTLESSQTIRRARPTPVVFSVYGWSEIIPMVRKAIGVEKLIVLAPNESEAQEWLSAFAKTQDL